jgi:hypothetical protein
VADAVIEARQTAQAQLDEAMATLQDACWCKAKRLLSDARALSHLDRLNDQLALAVPERLYWNCRLFRDGKRKGHCPYELLGLTLPTSNWWELLQMDPKELEHKLLTQ